MYICVYVYVYIYTYLGPLNTRKIVKILAHYWVTHYFLRYKRRVQVTSRYLCDSISYYTTIAIDRYNM